MANVPSSRDGMASNKQVIWVRSQGQFLKIRNAAEMRRDKQGKSD
jgi:hypothetical protein